MKRSIFFLLIALCLLIATPLFAGTQSRGQVLYQPALYNTLDSSSFGNTRFIFRNTADETITLVRVDFYGPTGTAGGVLHSYVPTPIEIEPFASITFLTSTGDLGARGPGDGGRYFFMVEWESDVKVMPPIVEAARVIITTGIGVVAQSITPAIVIEQ